MSWFRRWGIIGALAVTQVGAVLCYQAFLAGHGSPARAAAAQQKPASPPKSEGSPAPLPPDNKTISQAEDIPLPPFVELAKPNPLPSLENGQSSTAPLPAVMAPAFPELKPGIVQAAAQEKVPGPGVPPPVVPDPKLPTLLPKAPGDAPKNPTEDQLKAQVSKQSGPPTDVSTRPLPLLPVGSPTVPVPPKIDKGAKTDLAPLSPPPQHWTKPSDPPTTVVPVKHQSVGLCPWALRIEIVKGKTQLTAAIGKEVQFRIVCEKLDLQAPARPHRRHRRRLDHQ